MKNKQHDIRYCGVREEKINSAMPKLNEMNFKRLVYWITERYKIHIKKDVYKLPAPWTDDKILQQYRFTNVRREHDRETIWLLKHISHNRELSYRNKILNSVLFRLFNKHETAELFKMPIDFKHFEPEDYRQLIEGVQKDNPKYVFFTSAFYTSGLKWCIQKYIKNEKNVPMRVLKFANYLAHDKFLTKLEACYDQKEAFDFINGYDGLGRFLAYQIFVDFTYIKSFAFSENEFTIAGPGCRSGLNYVFDDFDDLTYEEALFWLRDNFNDLCDERRHEWPLDLKWNPGKLFCDLTPYDRKMNLMSLEICHCEISKYIRALEGTGRPHLIYKPYKGDEL